MRKTAKIILLELLFLSIFSFLSAYSQQDGAFVFRDKCLVCHSKKVSYINLSSTGDILMNKKMIEYVIEQSIMPPWPPDNTYSTFKHNRSLTHEEKINLLDWLSEITDQTAYPSVKKPITQNGKTEKVKFQKKEIQFFTNEKDSICVFDIDFSIKDSFPVSQIIFQSNKLELIHHCNYFFTRKDGSLQSKDDILFAYGYSPGNQQLPFPQGLGFVIPKNGKIKVELHVPPISKDEVIDISLVCIRSDEPIEQKLQLITPQNMLLGNQLFLPADSITTIIGESKLTQDFNLYYVNPHMHLLGASTEAFVVNNNQDTVPLIRINKWQFQWQDFYKFVNPIKLQKGSTIYMKTVYDNTSNNPFNPNYPPADVYEGWLSSEEMFTLLLVGIEVD